MSQGRQWPGKPGSTLIYSQQEEWDLSLQLQKLSCAGNPEEQATDSAPQPPDRSTACRHPEFSLVKILSYRTLDNTFVLFAHTCTHTPGSNSVSISL